MDYVGNLIRPPSEANSIILQVTVGCPHNKCTFCGAYKPAWPAPTAQPQQTNGNPTAARQPSPMQFSDKNVGFRLKPPSVIENDIAFAARHCRRQKQVFLADGDVLALPQPFLLELFQTIRSRLPWVRKISLYGSGRSIGRKTEDDLAALKKSGLARIYMGLESGCNTVLEKVRKGCSAESMVAGGRKVRSVDLFLSVTVLLGLGGVELSDRHARLTAEALNGIQPSQVAALTLMILPGTGLADEINKKTFQLPGSNGILRELYTLISLLKLKRAQFHANHASNYLPIGGRLPRDRDRFLMMIEEALNGRQHLVPEQMRAL